MPARHARFLSFFFVALLFLAAVSLGLLAPLLTGMVVYVSVLRLSARLFSNDARIRPHAKWISVALIAGLVIGLFSAAGVGLHLLLNNGNGVHELVQKVGDIVASGSAYLPAWLGNSCPSRKACWPPSAAGSRRMPPPSAPSGSAP